jgi:hypothetical protein
MTSGAELSADRRYRYALWRTWGLERGVAFIGLNPSTADERADDPTIRRCIAFARAWDYDGIYMLNLYAFRATQPMALWVQDDPIGPDNDAALLKWAQRAVCLVAAWGAEKRAQERGIQVANMLLPIHSLRCLGMTKSGSPKHPLYLKGDSILSPWLYGNRV